jgi:hypothetical protein
MNAATAALAVGAVPARRALIASSTGWMRGRVLAHKSLVLPRRDAEQRRPGLRVVRMALLGGGNENGPIEENIHLGYAFKTDSIRSSRTSSRMRSQFAPGSALP